LEQVHGGVVAVDGATGVAGGLGLAEALHVELGNWLNLLNWGEAEQAFQVFETWNALGAWLREDKISRREWGSETFGRIRK
jgi:hypothetical protein